mmetsp:Transcript_31081/g.73788  ORF Transcript_31081/g.73788 Transcript_31081/m.73788 type:complete len:428 (-) Transcript_31081:964-2247(-)
MVQRLSREERLAAAALIDVLLRLLRHLQHLVDAHHVVLGRVDLLECVGLELRDRRVEAEVDQVEDQRFAHHLRGVPLLVLVELSGVDVLVHAPADAGHVGRLGNIIPVHPPVACRPHKHIVSEVANNAVGLFDRRDQSTAQQRNVLVVPSVAVGDGRAVGDAVDLVPVVPPRHHTRILGGVVAQPPVALAEVVDHHRLAVAGASNKHDRRVGEVLRHVLAVPPVVEGRGAQQHHHQDPKRLAEGDVLGVEVGQVAHERRRARGVALALGLALEPLRCLGRRGLRRRRLLLLLVDRLLRHRPRDEEIEGDPRNDRRGGREEQDQPDHLPAEVRRNHRVGDHEPLALVGDRLREEEQLRETHRCKEAHHVEVLPVHFIAGCLVLCDGVHQRVSCAGVLHEEPTDPRRKGPEVPLGHEEADHDREDQHGH